MLSAMEFESLKYELWEVDLAGDALIEYSDAVEHFEAVGIDPLDVVNNWRLCHAYPLNTFQATLRDRAARVDSNALVVQRIKRRDSIESKLRRYPELNLSDLQDIGGCRAILTAVPPIYELVKGYHKKYSTHILDDEDDYIAKPKSDGYRGYHLIYRYSDPNHPEFEGRKVEFQIRTTLQHYWATAVETVDLFLREGLKSHKGSPQWRRFFALMGTAMAVREGTKRIPRTPADDGELIEELRECAEHLQVRAQLDAFNRALSTVPVIKGRFKWVILELNPGEGGTRPGSYQLSLYGYKAGRLEDAAQRLEELERHKAKGVDAVIVSVPGAANLVRAYPNYFLNTENFLVALDHALE